jgi:hypothetical protein
MISRKEIAHFSEVEQRLREMGYCLNSQSWRLFAKGKMQTVTAAYGSLLVFVRRIQIPGEEPEFSIEGEREAIRLSSYRLVTADRIGGITGGGVRALPC